MRIIDAHVHIFENLQGFNGNGELRAIGNGLGRYANGEVVKMIPPELGDRAFTAETCYKFLREQGVEKAVLLQGSFYGFQNEYVVEAAEKYPDMFLPIGTFDPFGKDATKIYERLTKELRVKGLKFEVSTGCGIMSYHKEFDIYTMFKSVAKECYKNDQTLVLDFGSPGMTSFQPQSVAKLADENPDLRIVVCHLIAAKRDDAEELKRALEVLNKENVYFDLAAVPYNIFPEEYPYPSALRYIKYAKNIVGTEKLIWGTDLPSVLYYSSYQELYKYLLETDFLTAEELDEIFYQNALKAYRFE